MPVFTIRNVAANIGGSMRRIAFLQRKPQVDKDEGFLFADHAVATFEVDGVDEEGHFHPTPEVEGEDEVVYHQGKRLTLAEVLNALKAGEIFLQSVLNERSVRIFELPIPES